ncbi:HigA protein (antitoxin to HigB) [Hyphomicrobiales bacterium]|jgi:addiction module HigA family antidote|nr:HigA protein (antitoxin to HigB) [Hyphomicrobiales bacterium]CAH1696940.1 HigA protein (antitoxin to HigB) [Hyphomicrobiales bacterium]
MRKSSKGTVPADTSRRDPDRAPTHPGAILREDVLPTTGKTKVEIASLLGISRQTLYDILSEKQAVTPAIAVRLGKLFGNGPDIWLGLQQARDLWEAQRTIDVSAIPTLDAA